MFKKIYPYSIAFSASLAFFSLPFVPLVIDKSKVFLVSALTAQENEFEAETELDPTELRLREIRYESLYRTYRRKHDSYSISQLNADRVTRYSEIDAHEMIYADPYDFKFSPDDWYQYHTDEGLRDLEEIPEEFRDVPRLVDIRGDVVKLRIFGKTNVRASYGNCWFLSRIDDITECSSTAINRGFKLEMDMKVKIKGQIGRKVTVDIDYDQNEKQTEQTFKVQYKALRRREFVQEVTLGNIDLVFPKSEFAVFEQRSKKTIGVEGKMRRGKLQFHALATLTQGESAVDTFTGSTRNTSSLISEYKFTPKKIYQLEPYIYYGDATATSCTRASVTAALNATAYDRTSTSSFRTFTSHSPETFVPTNVSIDSGSLRLYLDDRDPTNSFQDSHFPAPNGTSLGNYFLLKEGTDFSFNPNTGRITMIRFLQNNHRLIARYTRNGGGTSANDTCDPSSRVNAGSSDGTTRIEIVLKWDSGTTINEDIDRDGTTGGNLLVIDDGVMNLDSYEVRSSYDLGGDNISQAGFIFKLVNLSQQNLAEPTTLGTTNIDYKEGVLNFAVREPFKQLTDTSGSYVLTDSEINIIYTDAQTSATADASQSFLRVDFTSEVRNYKLSHFNIINGSERARVNGVVISPDKYFIDYPSGFFTFIDENNPKINAGTPIEISYEYSPFGSTSQGYIVGLRTDYNASRDVKLGGTVLWNAQFEPTEAPQVGEEPISKLVLETDLSLKFREEKLTRLVNTIPGLDFDLLPARFEGYAEYARSYFNPNTFGLALIDDLESSEEVINISISDKNWILSRIPDAVDTAGGNECDRGDLLFKYYRDPNNFNKGLLTFEDGPTATKTYTELAGPYNVSDGHLDAEQLDISNAERQESLVLDFDFSTIQSGTGNPFVSIQTRQFATQGQDFSNLDFVEFYARLKDGVCSSSAQTLRVRFEVGNFKEDTDQDGVLDTEDLGLDGVPGTNDEGEGNNKLEVSQGTLQSEDVGYAFNPAATCGSRDLSTVVGAGPNLGASTRGNGVLDSEDLDRDGLENQNSNVLTIDDTATKFFVDQNSIDIPCDDQWYLVRVHFINASTGLSDSEKQALRSVKAVRMFLTPNGGSANVTSGKLLIDTLRFSGSKWRNTRAVDLADVTETEVDFDNAQFFRVTTIDNFAAKDEYLDEAFITQQRDVYESLHGKKTNTEIARTREAALKISYTLDSGGTQYRRAFARRSFVNNLDLRFYKQLVVWVNYRSPILADHSFLFRIGSSEEDYLEYLSPIESTGWQKLEFNLQGAERTNGVPNLKQVNTMMLGVQTTSPSTTESSIWINDIYVTEPETQVDDAYKYEATLRLTKPLLTTESGVPILSDIETIYKRKHKGRQFASIGQTDNNQQEDSTEWRIASQILPFWSGSYGFTRATTDTENDENALLLTQQGFTDTLTHVTDHRFKFENPHVPEVALSYTYTRFQNERQEAVSDTSTTEVRGQSVILQENTHSPAITIDEKFPEFWGSTITYQVKSTLRFYKRQETTVAEETSTQPETTEARLEKEQTEDTTNSITYRAGNFTLSPKYSFRQVKLLFVNKTDLNTNLETVHGNFYVPYFSDTNDFRFRQRQTNYDLNTSYKEAWIFSPNLTFSASYQETSFKDNIQTVDRDIYQRLKTPSTLANTNISVPIHWDKLWKKLKIVKSFTPTYSREITLTEQSLPFTERSSLYGDDLGLKRTLPPLADRAYNLFKYPFWHHFLSEGRPRNNFSNGREYIGNTSIAPETESNIAFQNYDNSLSLRENVNTAAQWAFYKPLILRTDLRLSQNINRSNLNGIPVHTAAWGYSILQNYDLMRVLNFWFWADKSHSSSFDLNFSFDQNKLITQNRRENTYAPETGITFKWIDKDKSLSSITIRFGVNIREFDFEKYLSNSPAADAAILETLPPEPASGVKETTWGYKGSIEYTTELPGFRRWLARVTSLSLRHSPKNTLSFSAEINRSKYQITALQRPDVKDQYILKDKLDANIHTNVTGGVELIAVWDVLRNGQGNAVKQEVIGFELAFFAKILF